MMHLTMYQRTPVASLSPSSVPLSSLLAVSSPLLPSLSVLALMAVFASVSDAGRMERNAPPPTTVRKTAPSPLFHGTTHAAPAITNMSTTGIIFLIAPRITSSIRPGISPEITNGITNSIKTGTTSNVTYRVAPGIIGPKVIHESAVLSIPTQIAEESGTKFTTPQPVSAIPQPVSTAPHPLSTILQSVSTTQQPVTTTLQPVSTIPQSESTIRQLASTTAQSVFTTGQPLSTTPQTVSTIPQSVHRIPQPKFASLWSDSAGDSIISVTRVESPIASPVNQEHVKLGVKFRQNESVSQPKKLTFLETLHFPYSFPEVESIPPLPSSQLKQPTKRIVATSQSPLFAPSSLTPYAQSLNEYAISSPVTTNYGESSISSISKKTDLTSNKRYIVLPKKFSNTVTESRDLEQQLKRLPNLKNDRKSTKNTTIDAIFSNDILENQINIYLNALKHRSGYFPNRNEWQPVTEARIGENQNSDDPLETWSYRQKYPSFIRKESSKNFSIGNYYKTLGALPLLFLNLATWKDGFDNSINSSLESMEQKVESDLRNLKINGKNCAKVIHSTSNKFFKAQVQENEHFNGLKLTTNSPSSKRLLENFIIKYPSHEQWHSWIKKHLQPEEKNEELTRFSSLKNDGTFRNNEVNNNNNNNNNNKYNISYICENDIEKINSTRGKKNVPADTKKTYARYQNKIITGGINPSSLHYNADLHPQQYSPSLYPLPLQRFSPSHQREGEGSSSSPPSESVHKYHELFYPRLHYHMRYLPPEDTVDVNTGSFMDWNLDASVSTMRGEIPSDKLIGNSKYEGWNVDVKSKVAEDETEDPFDNINDSNGGLKPYENNRNEYNGNNRKGFKYNDRYEDYIVLGRGRDNVGSYMNIINDEDFNSSDLSGRNETDINAVKIETFTERSVSKNDINAKPSNSKEKYRNNNNNSKSSGKINKETREANNFDKAIKYANNESDNIIHDSILNPNNKNSINYLIGGQHSVPGNLKNNSKITEKLCISDNVNSSITNTKNNSNCKDTKNSQTNSTASEKLYAGKLSSETSFSNASESNVVQVLNTYSVLNSSKTFGVNASTTNIIYNSDIIHPHQQHMQFKHEQQLQEQLLLQQQQQQKQEQQEQQQRKEKQDKQQYGTMNINSKLHITPTTSSTTIISSNHDNSIHNQKQHHHQYHQQWHHHHHKHQHHHHALLPPSLQLPPPPQMPNNNNNNQPPSIMQPSRPTQLETPSSNNNNRNAVTSYLDLGASYFQRPLWGYWRFWLTMCMVAAAMTGTCSYFRQKKMYESSASQTTGTGTAGPSNQGGCSSNNNSTTTTTVPVFPGLPFLNPRAPGSGLSYQLGFPFLPPAESSPSLTSTSPLYGPPLPFMPSALYAPFAPPPYSEATRTSFEGINSQGEQGRSNYEYYDRRHPNAYYDKYFPSTSVQPDDTSSSDAASLLSYRLCRSYSAQLPNRHNAHMGGRRGCDLPPPPPYSEVAAKPELYPVVVLKRTLDHAQREEDLPCGEHNHQDRASGIMGFPSLQNVNDNCAGAFDNLTGDNAGTMNSLYGDSGGGDGRHRSNAHETNSNAENGNNRANGNGRSGGAAETEASLIKTSKSVVESGSLQHPWMPPFHYYGYRSGSIPTPDSYQSSSTGGVSMLSQPFGADWWRGKGRVSPLLTSQLASPTSSPLPSDISSPPPTSPPSPPAPTSPSVTPYHISRRHQTSRQAPLQAAFSSSAKGAELKDLLQKINQLPGVPTPPPSPAVSTANSEVSSNTPTVVPPQTRSPSPATTASTPTPGARDFERESGIKQIEKKGFPIDDFRTHSLILKSKCRSQKSYFQSLHFPRAKRKSLQYVKSPHSSSSCSSPLTTPQGVAHPIMQSPQTVLQSPRSSNTSSQNLHIFAEASKMYPQTNQPNIPEHKHFLTSPQAILQSPQSPQSPQSQLLSWSLSTPNLTILTAPLMPYPNEQNSLHLPPFAYQTPPGSARASAYIPYTSTLVPVTEQPSYSSQLYSNCITLQQKNSFDIGTNPSTINYSYRLQPYSKINYHYSLNSHQHFGDLQRLPSNSNENYYFQLQPDCSQYQALPQILPCDGHSPLPDNHNLIPSHRNDEDQNNLHDEDEEDHVYTNVDLPRHPS